MASPFAIQAEPDILGAITARLRSFTEINTLTAGRIGGEIGASWFPGGTSLAALRLRLTGGPVLGDLRSAGLAIQRVDITAYGSSARAAANLLGYTRAALCPLQGGAAGSFTQNVTNAGRVRVNYIIPNAEAISDREPDTHYFYAWQPVAVGYSLVNA